MRQQFGEPRDKSLSEQIGATRSLVESKIQSLVLCSTPSYNIEVEPQRNTEFHLPVE